MKAPNPWITYRTRFLVKAKQLTASLTFTDDLGRQHSGRKGDYLVEFSDDVLRIAPKQIFEDIYVPLLEAQESDPGQMQIQTPIKKSVINQTWRTVSRSCVADRPALPPHLLRKSPQSDRGRQGPISQSL
jgi:hypothetical protein